ncbi:unnamed protein product, partial [Polarella glacialis]
QDPGPRGVSLDKAAALQSQGVSSEAGWTFDSADWWLEEHGLIMEQPSPLPPGKYTVTGDREVTTTLTLHPPDATGSQRWELGDGAKLYDVTHLPCRSARYTADGTQFPVTPGAPMPPVAGCRKQDYAVLFVLGE